MIVRQQHCCPLHAVIRQSLVGDDTFVCLLPPICLRVCRFVICVSVSHQVIHPSVHSPTHASINPLSQPGPQGSMFNLWGCSTQIKMNLYVCLPILSICGSVCLSACLSHYYEFYQIVEQVKIFIYLFNVKHAQLHPLRCKCFLC